ncbi:MAG: imidazole glycerol phosphate synthase subunit HisF [Anaerolineaceae bacterium]|nr:imidazole glycerol phosphate synthase subunit HisF [Anaerolineaceae bacterium]
MHAKRIIPCMDIANGRIVKGIHFQNLRDAGDPVTQAKIYMDAGADELVFLDISATQEARDTSLSMVEKVAREVFIPLTVGGGIRKVTDVQQTLSAGADKVSINTSAVQNPQLLKEASDQYGNQCILIAIDAKRIADGKWEVYTHGGRTPTGLDALKWAVDAQQAGAGEILLTSIDADGTMAGFDLPLTGAIASAVHIPVIASGGAGTMKDFLDVFTDTKADAALAASLFHDGKMAIGDLKDYLIEEKVPIRALLAVF